MKINEKTSMNNAENGIKSDEFMENSYEQINKDISKILLEMRKEKQNGIDNNDDFNLQYLDDEDKLTYSNMEEQLVEDFQIAQITNDKIGTTYKYIRPKEGHEGDSIPLEQIQTKSFPAI